MIIMLGFKIILTHFTSVLSQIFQTGYSMKMRIDFIQIFILSEQILKPAFRTTGCGRVRVVTKGVVKEASFSLDVMMRQGMNIENKFCFDFILFKCKNKDGYIFVN